MFWAALTLGDRPGAVWRRGWAVPANSDPCMTGRLHHHYRGCLGQMYASKATRSKGVMSVMENAPTAGVEEVGS
jgi:hypothetical protein